MYNMQIGDIMYMEFDFIWHGRTTSAGSENFFRVGAKANSNDCDGTNNRYPGLDISAAGILEVDLSESASCSKFFQLSSFGAISTDTSYHMEISFNTTNLSVTLDSQTVSWSRSPTDDVYVGTVVPVWWMSDKYGSTTYNLGNGSFSV